MCVCYIDELLFLQLLTQYPIYLRQRLILQTDVVLLRQVNKELVSCFAYLAVSYLFALLTLQRVFWLIQLSDCTKTTFDPLTKPHHLRPEKG